MKWLSDLNGDRDSRVDLCDERGEDLGEPQTILELLFLKVVTMNILFLQALNFLTNFESSYKH